MQEFLFPKASSQTAYHPVRSICHSGSPSLLFRAKYRRTAVFFKMQKGSVPGKCLSKAVHCMVKQSQRSPSVIVFCFFCSVTVLHSARRCRMLLYRTDGRIYHNFSISGGTEKLRNVLHRNTEDACGACACAGAYCLSEKRMQNLPERETVQP